VFFLIQCKLFEYLQQTVANNRRRAALISKQIILSCFSRKGVRCQLQLVPLTGPYGQYFATSKKVKTLEPMNSVEVGQFRRLRHAACYLFHLTGSCVYFYVFHKTAPALYSIRRTIQHEASY